MKVWRCSEFMLLLLVAARGGSAAPLKPAGELVQARGQITVSSGLQPRLRSAIPFAVLHNGDILTLATSSSARVNLDGGKKCYSLHGGSRVRVLNGHLLSLSGPGPEILNGSMAEEVLPAGLFDRGRESEQVRGGDPGGPTNPSPLFTVRGPSVTLHWEGSISSEDASSLDNKLRVRIKETGADRWAFSQSLPQDAHSISIPAGVLIPGRWYSWSVQSVGSGDLSSAGGPLRLLTSAERSELTEIENEIKAEYAGSGQTAAADQARAEACVSFGLLEEARQAYQNAQRSGGGQICAKAIQRLSALLNGSD